jgi:S-formylglutathione hydrolase FrmB
MQSARGSLLLSACVTVLLVLSHAVFAQTVVRRSSGLVSDHKLDSKLMNREMPYRVTLPVDYTILRDQQYSVIFLLHGLGGHFDNWNDKTKIEAYLQGYRAIIVAPEGGDGWYTDSVTSVNDKYETYIVKELIPEIDKKFRTLADREHRAIAGLSMGGYGAIKFGLKYPEMFSIVGSFSGAFDAPMRGVTVTNNWPSIISVYGPAGSDTRKSNDIFQLVRDASPEKLKSLPFIYLDCGTEDLLFKTNRDFSALLIERKIPHEYRERTGAHTWPYWESQVQEFLRVAGKYIQTR